MSPGSSIRVWRAASGDFADVEAIVTEYSEAVGILVRDDRRRLEQYFAPHSGIWLAARDACIVGCVALRPLTTQPPACEVKRLYVKERFRGMGVADALMDALEAYAASHGYHAVFLDTKDDLAAAIRFYERRGYRACERYNQNPQATIFMRRSIG